VRVHRHDHGRWQSSTAGEPMDRTTVSRDWHKQALQDAGLRDMPLHSLRHTAAASWLLAGQPLSLLESDLDQNRGSILVRHGKNDRRREVGMDAWAWSALEPWLLERTKLPVGPLFCVIVGPTCGHRWSESAARLELHRTATEA